MEKILYNKNIIGIIWMFGFMISITIMAISIRELSYKYSSFEIQNFRNFFSIIIIGLLFFLKKDINLKTTQFKNNLIRNTFHFIGQSAWTWGLTVLPLATVFSLEFTMPIWAAIISIIIFKENINLNKISFLILGLLGTWVILIPDTKIIDLNNIIVLFSAIAYAIAHNFTKALTKTDSILSILFFMSIIQLPFSLIGSLVLGNIHFDIRTEIPLILVLTITSLLAHYSLSSALKNADATIILPVDYIRLPIIIIIGWYYYNESVTNNIIIGSILIILGAVIFLRKDIKN